MNSANRPESLPKIQPFAQRQAGTGLTQHERVQFDLIDLADAIAKDPSLAPEVSRIVCLALPTYSEKISRIEAWAEAILRTHNMPDHPGLVEVGSDGSWRWWNADSSLKSDIKCWAAFTYAQQEEESEPWLASKAPEIIETLRQSTEKGSLNAAAIQLGVVVERHWWKFKHEGAALEGHRMMDGRQRGQPRGAEVTSVLARERRRAIVIAVQKLWMRQPDLRGNCSATARALAAMRMESLKVAPTRFIGVGRLRKIISEMHKAGSLA